MDTFLRNLRYALRGMQRSSGFTIVALLASFIPARRASRLNPTDMLRSE